MNGLLELYGRFLIRDGWKKAKFYMKHNVFHSMGKGCYIPAYISSREGYLISIGNNVWITHGVSLINHDASVQVVKKALNLPWVDKIGKIDIKDNVYIGNYAIVLPGVTIGPNAIVGGGTVVTKDVPPNSIVAGNPGRVISSFDDYAEKIIQLSKQYPWDETTKYDDLVKLRENYFWKNKN